MENGSVVASATAFEGLLREVVAAAGPAFDVGGFPPAAEVP
ncbi:hypothetical protein [Streptomyces melanogenes]|uniref:Uncharacterized protein n=1 Tax=Streptomyces melanogenes TaxID=67326 RepID=A0ABZ1XSI5_9ACTN|nr:hypothetical protein [Streptomyces melanogenes]